MEFKKIQLNGFKSFAENTTFIIDKGLVSIEFRNFPLDIAALNASKLAHCKNDGKSNILHFLYLKQEEWIQGNNVEKLNSNLKEVIKDQNFRIIV